MKKIFLLFAFISFAVEGSQAAIQQASMKERTELNRSVDKCCDTCCGVCKCAWTVCLLATLSYFVYLQGYKDGEAFPKPPSQALVINDDSLNQNYFGVIHGCVCNGIQLGSFATRSQCSTKTTKKKAFDEFVNSYADQCGALAQYYLYPAFMGCWTRGLPVSRQELGDMCFKPQINPQATLKPQKVPEKVAKIKAKLQTKHIQQFMPQARNNRTQSKR